MIDDVVALSQKRPDIFTIQYPPSRRYFQENYQSPFKQAKFENLDNVLLYLHIPFCRARCYFCNFAIDTSADESVHQKYIVVLIGHLFRLAEILPADCQVTGIDIGGGTPTLISVNLLKKLLQALEPWKARATAPRSLSIETTPSVASMEIEKMKMLADYGVDRISMGIQSTSNALLSRLNRKSFSNVKAIENLFSCEFRRINIDLIFGLPEQEKIVGNKMCYLLQQRVSIL